MLIKVINAVFPSHSSMILIKGPRYSRQGDCAQTKILSIQFKEVSEVLAQKKWDAHFLVTKSLKTHSIITFANTC